MTNKISKNDEMLHWVARLPVHQSRERQRV